MTRETRPASAVDLIPEAGFDLAFYRQFARNALDAGSPGPLRVLRQAPSIYLNETGFPASVWPVIESAIRATVPALTGGRFQVAAFERGSDPRPPQAGWIMVDGAHFGVLGNCGRADIGAPAGHVELNLDSFNHGCLSRVVIAHETGHALGFGHVPQSDALMNAGATTGPSETERYHAAIAYKRSAGNLDVDQDP